jgi:NhaP-type Na+/H+ or K+/H+ antiporter
MDVVLVGIQMALSIALPWFIVSRDMRRLNPTQLERSWNTASFWSAIVAFSLLALPVHFVKTRRSLWGFSLGIAWFLACVVVLELVGWFFG